MSLLKGWKLTLMAGMTLAGTSGQLLAQKPGSLGPEVLGSSRVNASPVSYIMDESPVPGVPMDFARYGSIHGLLGRIRP